MSQFYAYALFDPRNGQPFYVGKGRGRRCFDHLRCRGPNHILTNKIRQILAVGVLPTIVQFPTDSEAQAFHLERTFIALLGRRDLGLGPLLNYTDGGEGSAGRPCSERARRIVGEVNRARFERDPEARKVIADANRRRVVSEETRQKMRDARRRNLTPEVHARMLEAAAVANRQRTYPRGPRR